MEPNQEHNHPVAETVAAESTIGAPKALDLLKAGWEFAKTRRDLYLWYVVSLAVMSGLGSEGVMSNEGILGLVLIIAILVTMIFVAINSWSVIYSVSQPNISELNYKQTFGWASSNFFPLLWTSILSGLAVVFGLLLFVIPGIIVSIYFYFSLYAQAHGAKAGKAAIKQSYHDVKGRWWEVFKKLIGIGLYVLLVYIVVGMGYGIIIVATGESAIGLVVADILFSGIVGGVISVVVIHAIGHYYKFLRSNPLAQPEIELTTE